MPELVATPTDVVTCHAQSDTLDRLVPPSHGARVIRIAPDEVLVLASAGTGRDVLREIQDRVMALEPDAVAIDVTDGWTAWGLRGADAHAAFARISSLAPPAPGAFVQGDVARVGAKVIGEPDGSLTIVVPAYWTDHVRERCVVDAGAREVGP